MWYHVLYFDFYFDKKCVANVLTSFSTEKICNLLAFFIYLFDYFFAEVVEDELGKKLVSPNLTRWNSTYDAVKRLSEASPGQLDQVADGMGLPRFTEADKKFMQEFVKVIFNTNT